MNRRDQFSELVKKHGYTSINNFCVKNQLMQGNVNNRCKNESIKVEMTILFQWAKILHEPIDTLLNIFYPEEMIENRLFSEEE